MKFYDRTTELETLRESLMLSRNESQMTVVMGRRRIGKTELAKRIGDDTSLYFFVARKAEKLLCQDFSREIENKLGVPVGSIYSFADLFRYLLRISEQRPFTLVIDEFQEFMRINPSVFSEVQREWDLSKGKGHLNLVISGSAFSLMKKIFEDSREPLFGRANRHLMIRPFGTSTLKQILQDYNPGYSNEDLLALFSITGGVAWYVSLLMDNMKNTKKKMLSFITSYNSPFINEGKNVLIEEFGTDYTVHFSILTCIAGGMKTRGEIENILNMGNIGSYLVRLERYYGLIEKHLPIFAKENSKKTRYALSDNFLTLWFRFICKYQSFIENDALEQLARIIERDYESFAGFMLERYFERKLRETKRFTRIGGFWDRKGENEFDLFAVNEIDRYAEIYEVKMQKKKYDKGLLEKKVKVLLQNCDELNGMDIRLGCLSVDDM